MKNNITIGALLLILAGFLFIYPWGYKETERELKEVKEWNNASKKRIDSLQKDITYQEASIDSINSELNKSREKVADLKWMLDDTKNHYQKKIDSLEILTPEEQMGVFVQYTDPGHSDSLINVESFRIKRANELFIEGESCAKELSITQTILAERNKEVIDLENLIQRKDNIIELQHKQNLELSNQIVNCESVIKKQHKQIKKERRKTGIVVILGIAAVLLL